MKNLSLFCSGIVLVLGIVATLATKEPELLVLTVVGSGMAYLEHRLRRLRFS